MFFAWPPFVTQREAGRQLAQPLFLCRFEIVCFYSEVHAPNHVHVIIIMYRRSYQIYALIGTNKYGRCRVSACHGDHIFLYTRTGGVTNVQSPTTPLY